MAFAHPEIVSVATTSAPVPSLGDTEFAVPPLVVVEVRKSWDSIAPVESSEKALMYPVELVSRARDVAQRYLPE
jgi:hypothetical protein